jgi:hypothetical protein
MLNKYECSNGVCLEPRLQAYIEKKRYYKKHTDIHPQIKPEQEYAITQEDLRRVKKWLNGERDIYNANNNTNTKQTQNTHDEPVPKFDFDPEQVYKSDVRYQRFAKKMAKIEEASKQRNNQSNLSNEFEDAWKPLLDENMYKSHSYVPDERNFITGSNSSHINTPNKYRVDKPSYNKQPHKSPSIDYKNRIHYMQPNLDHNPHIENIIGQLDTYENKINKTYQHRSEMDTETKINVPVINCNNKKNINTSSYRSMPYMGRGEGIRNIDSEILMQNGSLTRTGKSFGYFNPVENYYDYISREVQDPDHVVFERANSTRLDNHKMGRTRQIY